MNSNSKNCCICFNNYRRLYKLSRAEGENQTLQTKLESVVPQIEWLATYRICHTCTNLLEIAYTFRESCIKSDDIRKQQLQSSIIPIAELNSVKYELDDSVEENECIIIKDDDSENDDEDKFDGESNDFNAGNEEVKEVEVKIEPDVTKDEDCPNPHTPSTTLVKDCTHPQEKTKRANARIICRKKSCEICREEFTTLRDFIKHCVEMHSMKEKSIRPYSCNKCNKRFRTSSNMINHRMYHDGNRIHICNFCGKTFITKNDLRVHKELHYNSRNYKCDKCEKAFKTNTNLRTHQLIVHTDPSLWKYACHICNKRFAQKSNHDQHVRRHTGEKNFDCTLCRKLFGSKSELQEHVKYHSNIKSYKCTHCGNEYRKKHTYNVHLTKVHGVGNAKIPGNEKRHACHICPSRFFDKSKLTRHLCTHSGIKPFHCNMCENKFRDKSNLNRHLKVVHNIVESSIKTEWID